MRWMMGSIAVLAGTLGVMAGAVAMPENNSSLAPLTKKMDWGQKARPDPVNPTLLATAKMELKLNEGEFAMAALDVPNLPPLYTPVLIAQASQAQRLTELNRSVGVCAMVESVPRPAELGGGQNGLSPVALTRGYFKTFEHQVVSGVSKVTVLQNPAHGSLEDLGTLAYDQFGKVTRDTGERSYVYHAEAGYVGQDSATLLVEMGGYQVKVTYFFHVFAEVIYDDIPLMDQYCPNGYYWKISTTLDSNGTNTITSVEYQSPTTSDTGTTVVDTATLASTLGTTLLSNLAGETVGVTVNLSDLPGAAVGQTTGSTITLDTNAAGYNWFIDTTPADNSEFLPTSNPNEWVAKAGSVAAGKMDMLSVCPLSGNLKVA